MGDPDLFTEWSDLYPYRTSIPLCHKKDQYPPGAPLYRVFIHYSRRSFAITSCPGLFAAEHSSKGFSEGKEQDHGRCAEYDVGALQAEESLLIATAGAIDRNGQPGAAGLLGAPDMIRRDLELVGGVELHPDRSTARLDDVFDRGRGLIEIVECAKTPWSC